NRLYVLDQAGEAICLDAASGKETWKKNLLKEMDLAKPAWFFSGSPLVLDKVVVFAVGTAGAALDKTTGEKAWLTGAAPCGNASPVLFEQNGPKQVAIFGRDKLFTVEAD